MAKPLTQSRLLSILRSLDWTGHIELGDLDLRWLAGAVAARLSSGHTQQCQLCDELKEVVVMTSIGAICEACLEDAQTVARETRELLEEEDE